MSTTVLIGEGALALLCLDALIARGLTPALACSFDGTLTDACARLGVPHVGRREEVRAWLDEHGCDWLLSVRNPWIIPAASLATVRQLAINFHDAPLPRYAGLHATSWALVHGEREHGISWHEITPGIDEGRLLVQVPVPIADDDTALTLNVKCLEAAATAFERVLAAMTTGTASLEPQTGPRSYFSGEDRPGAQCSIDWEQPAQAIVDLVRALGFGHTKNPLGSPKLWVGERVVVVGRAVASPTPSTAAPGTVLGWSGGSLRVATRTSEVVLSELCDLDGRPLTVADGEATFGSLASRSQRLTPLDDRAREELSALDRRAARSEREWIRRLAAGIVPVGHPYVPAGEWGRPRAVALPRLQAVLSTVALPLRRGRARAVVAAYLARLDTGEARDLGMVRPEVRGASAAVIAPIVPSRLPARTLSFSAFEAELAKEQSHVGERLGSFTRDLGPRTPELRGRPLVPARWPVALVEAEEAELRTDVAMSFCVSPDGDVRLLASDAIPSERLAAIDAQLSALAHAAIAGPEQPVERLPLLDAAERERVLVEWNATQRPIPRVCVHELVHAQAVRTPAAPAVRFGDTVLTYAELDARAEQLAHALRERGVREGDLVAIAIPRSVELVVGLLAILKSGAAYVPIDVALPRERIELLVRRSQPVIVLTDATTRATMAELGATLCVHTDAAFVAAQPCTTPLPAGDPERLVYVIFTSGSTGEPKAVEIRHRSLVNHGLAVQDHYGLGPGDRMLCSASIGFDVAAEQIYPALFHGAEVVVRPDDLLESFAGFDAFVRARALTAMILPTAFWHEWVRYLQERRLEVPPTLRLLSVGTEKALSEILVTWRERGAGRVRFIQGYGPTETTVTCTMFRHDAGETTVDPTRPLPIGRPLANNEIYILDATGEPVPVGVPGELCVGGAGLARGYLGRPDLTAERFVAHPLRQGDDARIYKTGDLAYWQPDGQIVYVGRSDFQVKVRGFRVELGEIEALLRSHPGVRESVVVLRDEPKRLVAYLVGDPGLAIDELEARCRAQLPEYMVPAAFVVLDAFPLTHNGKVDRAALPRPDTSARPRSRDANDDVELILAGAFAEVLRAPAVGMTDGFFDLGGDSLAAMKLLQRLESIFSLTIPLEQLLRTDTVESLGEHIRNSDRAGSVDGPSVVRLKGGEGTPVFLVLGMFMYQYLARALQAPNPVYSVYLPLEAELLSEGKPLPEVHELARLYVEVLRRHTPSGPYVLGGASFGGIVAYEMAQQLRAAGEAVELVVLLDSMLPRGRQNGASAWARVIAKGLLEQREWVIEKVKRRLQRVQHQALQRLRRGEATVEVVDPEQAERARLETLREAEYERCQQAYDRVMRPYGGEVVLYRSQAPKRPVMPYHGFEELVTGRLEACDVPGDHVSMLLLQQEIGRMAGDLQRRLTSRASSPGSRPSS